MKFLVFSFTLSLINPTRESTLMNLLKTSLPLVALLALAACKQETAAPTDSAAPAAGSAVVTATAASAASVPLAAEKDAQWQSYQCHDGLTLSARYFDDNGKPAAEVRFDNQTFKLPHSSEYSNQDLIAFSDGSHTWTVSNQYQTDLYKEDNGFLVRHEKQQVNSEVMSVDDTMVKNCMPAK